MTDETAPDPAEEPTFAREWTVRFADADPFGIAHYPRIVDAIHETADAYAEAIGWPFWELIDERGIGLPIVDVGAQFDRPLEAGDVVTIGLVPRAGETSVRFEFAGVRDGETAFTAHEQRVCVPVDGDEPIPLPDALRAAFRENAVRDPEDAVPDRD